MRAVDEKQDIKLLWPYTKASDSLCPLVYAGDAHLIYITMALTLKISDKVRFSVLFVASGTQC